MLFGCDGRVGGTQPSPVASNHTRHWHRSGTKVTTSDLFGNGHLNLQISRPDLLPSGNILPGFVGEMGMRRVVSH